MLFFCFFQIIRERPGGPVGQCQEEGIFNPVVEFAFAAAGIFHKGADIRPYIIVTFTFVCAKRIELVRHLLYDVRGHLADVNIVLQITSGNVERQFRAVQYAAQHQQIFGDDFLDVVCDEHLIVEQLDLTL